MTKTLGIDELLSVIRDRGKLQRSITALAGPPGTGKSTLSARLVAELNHLEPGSAAILQMDGFHFDDAILKARGLLAKKGAPETFDTGGLIATLARLRSNQEPEVAVPLFDRALEISRGSAAIIPQSVRHVLVEGNYLLYSDGEWGALSAQFDTTVWIHTDIDILRQRLTKRWHDLGLSREEVDRKVEDNDIPNAEKTKALSADAEFEIPT